MWVPVEFHTTYTLTLIYVAELDLACSEDEVDDHVCIKIGAHESYDNVMMEYVPSLVLVKDLDWNPLTNWIIEEFRMQRIIQLYVRKYDVFTVSQLASIL